MRGLKALTVAALALMTILLFVPARQAQAQTPSYLHAISDLRSARAYLQMDNRPNEADARARAIEEINHALDDIKVAAVDDGKTPWRRRRRRAEAIPTFPSTPPSGCSERPVATLITATIAPRIKVCVSVRFGTSIAHWMFCRLSSKRRTGVQVSNHLRRQQATTLAVALRFTCGSPTPSRRIDLCVLARSPCNGSIASSKAAIPSPRLTTL